MVPDRTRRSVSLVLLAAGMPTTLAQQSRKIPLVVNLGMNPLDPGEKEATIDWILKGLRGLGYVEGKNIVFEYRHANGKPEQLSALIEEQIRRKVDVLYSARPDVLLATMRATRSIPIVFSTVDDPVGAGIVESLAKPGRNVTGLAWDSNPEIAAKQFQLLREMVPGSRTLAVLWNPDIKGSPAFFRAAQSAAKASGVTLQSMEVQVPADFEAAFASMSSTRVQAVLILGSWFSWQYRESLAGLAAKRHLPAIYGNRDSALAGGLMSYGPNLSDIFLRAAVYIDKVLKGAKPADLPVEQPTKFELVVNLRTAKALGLTIPRSVRLQATEVIE